MSDPLTTPQWTARRWQRMAFIAGAIAAAISVFGGFFDALRFFRSYLFAYVFWLCFPLGSLAILMMHHLVGGAWGRVIRGLLETATRTLPLTALLFVPLFFGLQSLYPWARPELLAADPLLQHKAGYLNVPFFIARTILYLGLWSAIAYLLNRWSRLQDTDPAAGKRLRRLSGPGLLLYFLTMTFAAIDWIMSIEPHWYSSIYGVIWIVNQGLAGFAFAVLMLSWLADKDPFVNVLHRDHFQDLGNLLLAFVMLWAYMNFSQYLIIWSANITEEIPWYLVRTRGGLSWIPPVLIVFHFAVPFVLLLMRDIKRNPNALLWVAAAILLMRVVDTFWLVMPAFHQPTTTPHWLDLTLFIGIGGIWLGFFFQQLGKRPALALDSRVLAEETATHG